MSGETFSALSGINWDTYWLYLLTEAALSLSPGPAVMLVIAYGLTQGARRSVFASLGILSANAIYFALSATALGAILASSPAFFSVVRWFGAGYLVYVGVLALIGQPSPITVSTGAARATSRRAIYLSGLALQLANPKTLVFFIAILPQFVNARSPIGLQMMWLAAGSIVPEFAILLGYGFLASRAAGFANSPRFARLTDRAAGVFVLLAAGLVLGVTS
jgi:homoserine/homoserine lactone efflux protein